MLIPHPMEVVAHEIKPRNVFLETGDMKASEVPVASWNCNSGLPARIFLIKSFPDLRHEKNVVVGNSTAVASGRILPVDVNAVQTILGKESHNRIDKSLSVGICAPVY